MLILLGITLNEYLLALIFSEDGVIDENSTKLKIRLFDIITLGLGLGIVFNIINIYSLIKNLIAYFQRNLDWVLFIQVIIFCVYLWDRGQLFYHTGGWGDEPSYVLFSFSSLKEILGQHRTFGLPVILKLFDIVFNDYELWPTFQMFCFVLSIFFVYWAFCRFGFDQIMSFIVVSILLLIWVQKTWFAYIMTEPLAATCLNFTVGSFLLTLRRDDWKSYLMLGVFTFFLYQIRPAFAFVPALIPLWAVGISLIFDKPIFTQIRRIFLRFSAATLFPLLLFCFLRLFVVGQFGVVSLMGVSLAGHATHYLDEDNIELLSGKTRILANEILSRKRKLSYPCYLAPFTNPPIPGQSKYVTEWNCWNNYNMTSWLVAIKQKTGREPFNDPIKNVEAWKHLGSLSGFFSIYNAEIDQALMEYAIDIIKVEYRGYIQWIIGGTYHGLKNFLKNNFSFGIFLILMGILGIQVYLRIIPYDKELLGNWNKGVMTIVIIGLTLFAVGFIPIIFISTPGYRLLFSISQYLFPALVLLLVPPFWLRERNIPVEK